MKKLVFTLLSVLILASCASELLKPSEDESVSKYRTTDEIKSVAEQMANTFCPSPSRSSNKTVGLPASVIPLQYKSRSNDNESQIYAVNYDNDGYALVIANKDFDGTLAFIPEGSYTENTLESNPALEEYLTCIEDALKEYSMNSNTSSQNISTVGKRKIYDIVREEVLENVNPKVTLKLGQHYPEGMFFDNGCSGCAQTAAAMAMSYFEEPKSLNLTYPGHSINTLYLNWSEIKKHTGKDSTVSTIGNSCPASLSAHESIGHLCREIGQRTGAFAKGDKTGTYLTDIPSALASILTSRTVSSWNRYQMDNSSNETTLINLIKSNAIIYMTGQGSYMSNGKPDFGGHGWIIDGYKRLKKTTETVSSEEGSHEFEVLYITEEINSYYHFNWGWNGKDNGYFNLDNWHTRQADSYTDPKRTLNKINFNMDNEYIYIK